MSDEIKKQEKAKAEAPKEETPKVEAKAEAPKEETPKAEAKAEAPKEETPKAEAKAEAPKEETPKVEAKAEAPKEETPKAEAKAEAPKEETKKKDSSKVQLDGLFAFKLSMTAFYNDKGVRVPVTALEYKPWKVSQIKTKEKEGYSAIQLACQPQKNKRCSKATIKHLTPAGFKEGARYVKELRQEVPEGLKVGQEVSIDSLKKGDLLKITSRSKGLGFTGVMKRWNFSGGKASHGSKSHRRTGSIGQHTEPARVMPGRKMPGRCGFKNETHRNIEVVDVYPEEGVIFIKGSIPGARNTLVTLKKMRTANA